MNFYTDYVFEMRKAGRLSLNSVAQCDHELHKKLLAEEQKELDDATELHEIADALGDIITVAEGYRLDALYETQFSTEKIIENCEKKAIDLGINIHAAFLLIHESNMSKLCTKENLNESILALNQKGIAVEVRSGEDGKYALFALNDTPNTPNGKWLKGAGYHKPKWDDVKVWML